MVVKEGKLEVKLRYEEEEAWETWGCHLVKLSFGISLMELERRNPSLNYRHGFDNNLRRIENVIHYTAEELRPQHNT